MVRDCFVYAYSMHHTRLLAASIECLRSIYGVNSRMVMIKASR